MGYSLLLHIITLERFSTKCWPLIGRYFPSLYLCNHSSYCFHIGTVNSPKLPSHLISTLYCSDVVPHHGAPHTHSALGISFSMRPKISSVVSSLGHGNCFGRAWRSHFSYLFLWRTNLKLNSPIRFAIDMYCVYSYWHGKQWFGYSCLLDNLFYCTLQSSLLYNVLYSTMYATIYSILQSTLPYNLLYSTIYSTVLYNLFYNLLYSTIDSTVLQ